MEAFVTKHDPTRFSRLAIDFESWILDLLSQTSVKGIPDRVLVKFQAAFEGSAYPCRYSSCLTLPNSFATPSLRAQHETTHFLRLYCEKTSCPWNRIGFKAHKALKIHVQEHHSQNTRLTALAGTKLTSEDTSSDSVRKQTRTRLEEDWSPVFSYERRKNYESLAQSYLDKVSPNHVRQGRDWFAFFEPHQPRTLDIEVLHTLPHDYRVMNVKFSPCGKYIATHCMLEVFIFAVETGLKTAHLVAYDSVIWDICYRPIINSVFGVDENGCVLVLTCFSPGTSPTR